MRPVTVSDTPIVIGLLAIMFALLLFTQLSMKPRLWIYPVVRQVAMAKLDYETRNMQQYPTEHFLIKYTAADADQVPMVAEAAEAAYRPVTDMMGYVISKKATIYIYPDRQEMRKAFGWSGDESAMGVYYGGVIEILSPKAWLKSGETAAAFVHNGPMAHEFTHLVLDYQTNGNYSRWFTEGLAQYTEYKVNHYEWITPTNHLTGNLYTLAELDDHFDDLPNQALAYRESLAAVRFIADNFGEGKLRQIDGLLAQGETLKEAIPSALGLTYAEYEQSWRTWAMDHMEDR
jgi:hypothetical protein